MQHYLRPLVSPASVGMVGASEREGSVGRIAFGNLLRGGFSGPIYAVNPRHAQVLGERAYPSLSAIGKPVDLAVIATPPDSVVPVLEVAARAGVKAAVVMTVPPARRAVAAWNREVRHAAQRHGIHIIGANAFGVIRTDIGLNATFCAPIAHRGRLALVAQSGAVATALLDFAAPQHFGFSTVISLGTGLGVGFGELLDCLVLDSETDGILLYVENVTDARRFLSALRSAARSKPAIVLKAGRSLETSRYPSADAVFDAALRRAGSVRVQNYTQLFAAARILSIGRIPRSERLAIVSNGRGPALLAADSVAERGVERARLTQTTVAALTELLPEGHLADNPVDLRGDAPASRLAQAVERLLEDPGVDALVALHVARPAMPALEAAHAVAKVARHAQKPVLGAWLGAVDRQDVHDALESGGVVNFYTPENAVTAFSFLATYRRNQSMLLEVPPLQPEPEAIDPERADRLRARLAESGRTLLVRDELVELLGAFGIEMMPAAIVHTIDEALQAAARWRFPVVLSAIHGGHALTRTARTRAALEAAWRAASNAHDASPTEPLHVRIEKRPQGQASDLFVDLATDACFGPVITVGAVGHRRDGAAVMLPPLSRSLAHDLIQAARGAVAMPAINTSSLDDALVRLLLRVSTLVGALPWLVDATLERITVVNDRCIVGEARARANAARKPAPGYRHMAIHPYPVELLESVSLRDGATLTVRPIRPEDAELEREFVETLSPESRYLRFFYQLHQLTPAMLARFTQVDYDREMALVAVTDVPHPHGHPSFVGVARYNANPDGESAEFAIVVTDAWQNRGVARALMSRLIESARRRGFTRLVGTVLRTNTGMLEFARRLGFAIRDDAEDSEQLIVSLDLGVR
jgi:acetyltransferase